jgi:hypothetical protein
MCAGEANGSNKDGRVVAGAGDVPGSRSLPATGELIRAAGIKGE